MDDKSKEELFARQQKQTEKTLKKVVIFIVILFAIILYIQIQDG